jgi:quercetin dioxygenase-like cupin family protein
MQILTWADIEAERISDKITRRMFWGANVMVTKWELAPGTELPVHDHVSEQVSMVESGSVTLIFPTDGEEAALGPGDILVIAASKPHGVRVGAEGCVVTDLFSPIREDFIKKTSSYLPGQGQGVGEATRAEAKFDDAYRALQGALRTKGVKATLDELKEFPLDILARYAYERECLSMGQLRKILDLDKEQAKALIRKWKHGDDLSETSLKRKMERLVLLPGDKNPFGRSV